MQKALLFLAASALLVNAVTTSPSEAVDFLEGLINGLEADATQTGACGTDLKGTIDKFEIMITHVSDYLKDLWNIEELQVILDDYKAIQAQIATFGSDCDWDSLKDQLKAIFGPNGLQILTGNYFKHLLEINENLNSLKTCLPNYNTCGQLTGSIFRLLVNWTLNSSSGTTIDWTFIDGFLTGIQAGTSDKCKTDLVALQPSIEAAAETAQQIANGNIFVIGKCENQVIAIEDEIFVNDAIDCNWAGLNSVLAGLLTPEGVTTVVNNYLDNWQEVNEEVMSVVDCTDYSTCGANVGKAIKTVLGWGTN